MNIVNQFYILQKVLQANCRFLVPAIVDMVSSFTFDRKVLSAYGTCLPVPIPGTHHWLTWNMFGEAFRINGQTGRVTKFTMEIHPYHFLSIAFSIHDAKLYLYSFSATQNFIAKHVFGANNLRRIGLVDQLPTPMKCPLYISTHRGRQIVTCEEYNVYRFSLCKL